MELDELRLQLESHHEACFGWALHCCSGDPDVAEDALQTIYLKVLEGRLVFRGESAFRTWIFGVIRNGVRDHYRKRSRWREILDKLRGCGESASVPWLNFGVPAAAVAVVILFLVMRSSGPEVQMEEPPPAANLESMEELPALIETTVAIVATSRWEAPTDFLLSNDYQLTPNQP